MQMLFHFTDEIARRLKAAVPSRQRSSFVQQLVEDALRSIEDDDPIYRAALAAEADVEHDEDRDLWDTLSADGLDQEA
ncbi:MAG TPA: hypothetical protein VHW60_20075 [Caulobacteraceae bacterium]|jgi:hypothetical protein|nr:hypothetical protein [Caulobacteraceae bacterium]